MTLAELNALKPGPGKWPHLIMDADGSHSREVDRFFDIVDAELTSEKKAHHYFDSLQRPWPSVRSDAHRVFCAMVVECSRRNPGVLTNGISEHVKRLVAWAILDQWLKQEAA